MSYIQCYRIARLNKSRHLLAAHGQTLFYYISWQQIPNGDECLIGLGRSPQLFVKNINQRETVMDDLM